MQEKNWPRSLANLASLLDKAAIWSGHVVGWLLIPMILSLAYEVTARYVFGKPTVWAYDMTFMLFGAFFMLGAAFTLQRGGHIRTDMLYGAWRPRTQAAVDLVGYLVFFAPLVFVFIYTGWEYFATAWANNERFVSSPWAPVVWPFKLVIPVTGVLLLIQGTAEVMRCVVAIDQDRWPERHAERHAQ